MLQQTVKEDGPQRNDKVVALEHAQLEVLVRVLEIANSNSVIRSLLARLLHCLSALRYAIDSLPHIHHAHPPALKTDSLNGNTTLVLGTASREVPAFDLEGPRDRLHCIGRVPVGFL